MKEIELADEGPNRDLAVATIEIDNRYAPIPENTRAQLREKTLLGEAYVELTQGDGDGPKVPEGGSLAPAQVTPSVQLDEIFRAFDTRTRLAFQTWMEQAAVATAGRGADLSAAIANLEPFADDANRVLRVLDTQENAVKALVRDTGVVFGALSERRGQLRGLIDNAGAVFATTARRNQDLREAFVALPTFLDESRLTLNRLDTLRRQHQSADHPASPGGARAVRRPCARSPGWPPTSKASSPASASSQRARSPACPPCAPCSTTICRLCLPRSSRSPSSSAPWPRPSAATGVRSPARSATSPPPPTRSVPPRSPADRSQITFAPRRPCSPRGSPPSPTDG